MPKCYPTHPNKALAVIGYAMLGLGIVVLFVCIPCWAWLALAGVALIALGWLLLRSAWR